MALNLDAIGRKIGPLTRHYDWKDVILYALGVGSGFDELDYVYEKHLKVIPSFSIAAVLNILAEVKAASGVNVAGILHGEQELVFYNPIPTSGAFITEARILNYYDKGEEGALIVWESNTSHSNGQKLFTNIHTIFSPLDGGFDGQNAPARVVKFPACEPDFRVRETPSPNQPLLYRLSGDFFKLHVDSEFAAMAGFEKPVMHGLCTHGFSCRALIKSLCPGHPEMARRMACRFSKPLYPGDPIEILIWKTAAGEAVWRVLNSKTGDLVIDKGIFEYGKIPENGREH